MNKNQTTDRIKRLKRERNAVILAHNYQVGDIQDLADFVGDSLDLSIQASRVDEDVILFCGVHFMAETAAILAPDKTVLIPDPKAGCPMADMITGNELRAWKDEHPGKKVVCYVNTTAEVKAESDICCTSANAQRVASAAGGDILFAPDRNLASFVARSAERNIIPWQGYCLVHDDISAEDIRRKRALYPDAEVWVHPECRPEVIDLADRIFSTGKMVAEARSTKCTNIIIGTEIGIIHRLKKENPGKNFIAAKDDAVCRNMKKITLDKVLASLEDMKYIVKIPPEISRKARRAIEKMIEIGRSE